MPEPDIPLPSYPVGLAGLSICHENLDERWSLSFSYIEFVTAKPRAARLGLAAQSRLTVSHIWQSSSVLMSMPCEYDFGGRTARRHCAEILQHHGFRRLKQTDRKELVSWIASDLCPTRQSASAMLEEVFLWCRDRRIYGPVAEGAGTPGSVAASAISGNIRRTWWPGQVFACLDALSH